MQKPDREAKTPAANIKSHARLRAPPGTPAPEHEEDALRARASSLGGIRPPAGPGSGLWPARLRPQLTPRSAPRSPPFSRLPLKGRLLSGRPEDRVTPRPVGVLGTQRAGRAPSSHSVGIAQERAV